MNAQKEEFPMVTITLHCPHSQSDALVRNGHAPNGKELSGCHVCRRQSRENPTPYAYPQARREEILHASQERSSLRGLTRTFGVSRTTGSGWIKTLRAKAAHISRHLPKECARMRFYGVLTHNNIEAQVRYQSRTWAWVLLLACVRVGHNTQYSAVKPEKPTAFRLENRKAGSDCCCLSEKMVNLSEESAPPLRLTKNSDKSHHRSEHMGSDGK